MLIQRWLHRLFGPPTSIPETLWEHTLAELPCLHRLSPEERQRLKQLAEDLLASKSLGGAAGLEISNEMAVSIAAQACLPILNLGLELYRDISSIIVYPAAFLVARQEMDEAGVVHEWQEPLSGEAMDAGGAVVLSWEDIADPAAWAAAENVVIHEFVHKIDMLHGGANGCPPFLSRWHAGIDPGHWQQVFHAAYADLRAQLAAQEDEGENEEEMRDGSGPAPHQEGEVRTTPALDTYAATHPAEFFAVACEVFFMQPATLHAAYPGVHALLAAYYRQQPLEEGLVGKQSKDQAG